MLRASVAICGFLSFSWVSSLVAQEVGASSDKPPHSLDKRLEVRLVAEHPQLVTPTGIDVDTRGRIWVLESNTHFTPAEYKGHPSDRLLVLEETNSEGPADRITTFADGFKHAMSVAARPGGAVYVATRREVLLLRDENNDLQPESRERMIFLDTPGDYPHNGLAGLAFDALGHMYIGLGENLGAPYKIIGSDDTAFSGEGEGGSLYRCRLDGTNLERVATGFWNPHATCLDAFGRVFSVDNDPDSRPPCRLLHIIDGGDYGYRFRNGRRGTHPFTAWDGELPGTLPMVAGTGEAPSGIVSYESDGLPAEYIGNLLVTSWGDHRIDRFQLKPKGSSFTSQAEPLIVGGQNFRPVGLAVAPDGSLICSDWVSRDYSVHGQGRVWRISPVDPPHREVIDVSTLAKKPVEELKRHLESPRLDIRRAAAQALAEHKEGAAILRSVIADKSTSVRARIESWWALQQDGFLNADDVEKTGAVVIELPALAYPDDEVATAHANYQHIAVKDIYRDFNDVTSEFLTGLRRPQSRDALYPLSTMMTYFFLWKRSKTPLPSALFEIEDHFVFAEAVRLTSRTVSADEIAAVMKPEATSSARARLGLLLAARRQKESKARKEILALGLADPDPGVKRAAVQWVGEEKFTEYRPQVERILDGENITSDLLDAVLASLEMLDGVRRDPKYERSGAEYLFKLISNEKRSGPIRAMSLRLLPPDHPGFTSDLARSVLAENDEELRLEGVRAVTWSRLPDRVALLQGVAADESASVDLRAEAISGLANGPRAVDDSAVLSLLTELLNSPDPSLRIESLRTLRSLAANNDQARETLVKFADQHAAELDGSAAKDDASRDFAHRLKLAFEGLNLPLPAALAAGSELRPVDAEAWIAATETGGDPVAGRRVFLDAGGAGCVRCHTVRDRGARIGPDLSTIARTQDRRKLAESILFPSKEVAPQFVTWSIVMRDGRVHNGLIVADREEMVRVGLSDGTLVDLKTPEIEERLLQRASVMPEKLVDRLTVAELRDLLAFLQTRK